MRRSSFKNLSGTLNNSPAPGSTVGPLRRTLGKEAVHKTIYSPSPARQGSTQQRQLGRGYRETCPRIAWGQTQHGPCQSSALQRPPRCPVPPPGRRPGGRLPLPPLYCLLPNRSWLTDPSSLPNWLLGLIPDYVNLLRKSCFPAHLYVGTQAAFGKARSKSITAAGEKCGVSSRTAHEEFSGCEKGEKNRHGRALPRGELPEPSAATAREPRLQLVKGGRRLQHRRLEKTQAVAVLATKRAGPRGCCNPAGAEVCDGRDRESCWWRGRGAARAVQDAQGSPLPDRGRGMKPAANWSGCEQSPCKAGRWDEPRAECGRDAGHHWHKTKRHGPGERGPQNALARSPCRERARTCAPPPSFPPPPPPLRRLLSLCLQLQLCNG